MSAGILRTCLKTALPLPIRQGIRGFYNSIVEHFLYHFGGVRRASVRNREIFVGVQSRIEAYRVDTYETKEPDTLDWLDLWLQKKNVTTFFDIGANIGLYSLYAAKVRPNLNVYSFEPHPQNFANLCKNIRHNSLEHVYACNFALTIEFKFAVFNISDLTAGSAYNNLLPLDPSAAIAGYNKPAKQKLLCIDLDRLVYELGVPAPDLMKIDVDGVEDLIIEGAEKLLRSGQVKSILIELNSIAGKPSPIENKIKSFGFRLASRGMRCELPTGEISENIVFDFTGS